MQTNVVLSAIHFILVVFLGGLSLALTGIYFSGSFRVKIGDTILYQPQVFFALGLGLAILTLFLLLSFYVLYRKKALRYRMGSHSASIQQEVVLATVERYWKEHFPSYSIHTEIVFHQGKKLEIILSLPTLEEKERKEFLKKSEKELGKLLYDHFDYDKDFYLTLSSM